MRLAALLVAGLLFLFSVAPVVAAEPPQLIYGNATVLTNGLGSTVTVESERCQVRLNGALVVTAEQGTVFEVYPPLLSGGKEILRVTRGTILVIDEHSQHAARASENDTLFFDAAHAAGQDDAVAIVASTELADAYTQWQRQEIRQPFLAADYVMTRQQEYLSSLKVDVADLNRALASFIRQLIPRSSK